MNFLLLSAAVCAKLDQKSADISVENPADVPEVVSSPIDPPRSTPMDMSN
jgi:hypothetical protein